MPGQRRSRLHRRTTTTTGQPAAAEVGQPYVLAPPVDPDQPDPNPDSDRAPALPTIKAGMANVPAKTWRETWVDDFDSYAETAAKWNLNREAYSPTSGWWTQDQAGMPVPPTPDVLEVKDSAVWLYATRKANPTGKPFVNAIMSTGRPDQNAGTKPKMVLEAGGTYYVEGLLWNGTGRGTLSGFWLLGDTYTSDALDVFGNPAQTTQVAGGKTVGWPTGGEVDILEFVENNTGERGRPYSSLHWAKDDNPDATPPFPGSWLNREFMSHADSGDEVRTDLQNSWHRWGLYRSPTLMVVLIDGVELCRWERFEADGVTRKWYERWPNAGKQYPADIEWTGRMHLLLTYSIGGGWGGQGWTEAELENGKFGAKYVKVWRADA